MRALAGLLACSAVVLVFLPFPSAPLVALLAAVVAALLLEPAALRRAWGTRVLALALVFALSTGLLVSWSAGPARGLATGVGTLGRAAVLMILTALASRHINAEGALALSSRLHLERLGLVFSLALNALPHLGEACREAWIALAVRRFRARPRLVDMPRLVETLLAHTARVAEEAAEAAALRGHAALTTSELDVPAAPLVVVATGRAGSGKTPALREVARTMRARGVRLFGFFQVPVWEADARVGLLLHDVCSGEEQPLAVRTPAGTGQHGTGFRFDSRGFALARRALAGGGEGGVLVADEIGPVELRGGGHLPALRRAIAKKRPAAVLLGVRRQLVPVLLSRLSRASAVVVDVDETADPAAALLAALAPVCGTDAQPTSGSPGPAPSPSPGPSPGWDQEPG